MVNKLKKLLFQNQNIRQTIFKNIFWLTIGQIGSRLFRGIMIIYAARILGVSEYGIFTYAISLAGFFAIFMDLGIGSILIREIAKHPEKENEYFITSFWIKSVLFLITALLLIFVAPHFSKIEAVKKILPFIVILTIFDGLRDLISVYFRAKEKMELDALATTTTNVSITIIGIIILSLSPTAQNLAISYALSAGVGTLLAVYFVKEKLNKIFSYFQKKLVPFIIKSSLPIAFIGIINIFLIQTDIIMLGYFKTPTEVGLYSASQKIVQLIYVLPGIITMGFYPALSRFAGKNNEKTKLLIERAITTSFLLALPLFLGGLILAEKIMDFLYGSQYLPSAVPFKILISTILFTFPGGLINLYLIAYEKQKKLAATSALGSGLNIILNSIGIPLYGPTGAALATLISQIFYNFLNWRLAKKLNKFYILRYLNKIILGTIIMGGITFIFNLMGIHLLINIIISALVYFGILYILKEKTLTDLIMLIKK